MTLSERIAAYVLTNPDEPMLRLDNASLRERLAGYVKARNSEGLHIILELCALDRVDRFVALGTTDFGEEGEDYTPFDPIAEQMAVAPRSIHQRMAAILRSAADLLDFEPEHIGGIDVSANADGSIRIRVVSPVIDCSLPREGWKRKCADALLGPEAMARGDDGREHLAERAAVVRIELEKARGQRRNSRLVLPSGVWSPTKGEN